MKFSLFILFIAYLSSVKAQTTNNIKEVNELNIYGANAKISIGTVVVSNSVKPKVILHSSTQIVDSSGLCVTKLIFKNPELTSYSGLNITLEFDKPILSVFNSYMGEARSVSYKYNDNKTLYHYEAWKLTTEEFTFIIKSKSKIFTKIYGIDGVAN